MIELHDVSKSYGKEVVLKSTTLAFEDGKTTAIVGTSGSGKSTLLRLIAGLIISSTGEIFYGDQKLSPSTMGEFRKKIGFINQDGGLFPHLTARQNITLMARYTGLGAAKQETKLRELCQLTQFKTEFLDRYPMELSGGQCQRVSLMRALMLDPHILLLDEPFGALDPLVRSSLQDDLKKIFEQMHLLTIFVTHDLPEASYLADKIVVLNNGEVIQEGVWKDLVDRPKSEFITEFIKAQRIL